MPNRRRAPLPRVATVPGAVLCAVLVLAGCGPPEGRPGATSGDGTEAAGPALEGEMLVSAASSLADVFTAMASAFEAGHPAVEVQLNLGGSSLLRAQILEGAPVDVFASASRSDMERVVAAGEVAGEPRVFARNLLRIAVPAGNPAGVTGMGDLAREELLVGLCAEGVPCGDLAREALARAGVEAALDTEEPHVRALLTKVALGELDAAITYATDVAAAAGVEGIEIPEPKNVVAEYPLAVLAGAPRPQAARAFVAFVLSAEGQTILARHGFLSP